MTNFVKANAKAIKPIISGIKKAESTTVKGINAVLFPLVAGVYAGDNVVLLNNLLNALAADRRRKVAVFLNKILPNELSESGGKFKVGKKLANPKQIEKRQARFEEMLASRKAAWTIITEVAPKDEKSATDYAVKVERSIKQALEHGLTARDIMGILDKIAKETKEAPAKAA